MFNSDVKKNMYTGIIYQACTLIIGFVMRTYIINYLGIYNLGVIGVFENVANMLNLLDFGFGSACMYYLYKAFANGKKEDFIAIYAIFRKTYRKVAFGILAVGLFFVLNIGLVINIENNRLLLQTVLLLFILKSFFNHLLICQRTCLQCDGKRFVGTTADLIMLIIFSFIKVIFLIKTSSVIVYMILMVLEMILSALFVNYRFDRIYGKIDVKHIPENPELKKSVMEYSRSLAVSNINFFIYSSTDNIVLSKFCGTLVVGLMSNYYMIVNAIKGFITQIMNALEAEMVKNYNIENIDKKEQYDFSMFFYYCISSFCAICLYNLTDDFVGIFYGKDLIMSKEIILCMTIILIITLLKKPASTVVTAKKLVNKELPFVIAMSITNITLSIVLSFSFGAQGVLMGTIISEMILYVGDELLAFKTELNLNGYTLIKKLLYIAMLTAGYIISSKLVIVATNYFELFKNLLVCTFVFLLTVLPFVKTKEFRMLMHYVLKKNK